MLIRLRSFSPLASGALLVGNADVDSFRPELREELRRYSCVEAQNLIFEFQQGA